MAEPDLSLAAPLAPTPAGWVDAVLADFDAFLSDHASAEKKASGMAMNVASHYPDKPRLLAAMADLAVEELTHYREVIRLLLERGVQPLADTKDPYIRSLNDIVRKNPTHFLLDRLLMGAIVERRGAERFALIANAVKDPALAKFYQAIAASEERHWTLFVGLALEHCEPCAIWPRFNEMSAQEAQVMLAQPLRAALH